MTKKTQEKEVWTVDGRKKILLVNERNQIIKEIKDLGPLNNEEKLWVALRPGVPYKEWLEELKKELKKEQEQEKKKKSEPGHNEND
jgi:hypothetical protein